MNNKRIWAWTALVLVITLTLSVGVAFGRYMERNSASIDMQVKPLADLEVSKTEWSMVGETNVLKFWLKNDAESCRVFLAVSEGVLGKLQVYWPVSGSTWVAVAEEITPESALYETFGGGYVYRFYDDTGAERTVDLTTQEYALSIVGLSDGAQQTTLLRLFVEYVPE